MVSDSVNKLISTHISDYWVWISEKLVSVALQSPINSNDWVALSLGD